MHQGKLVSAQVMARPPLPIVRRRLARCDAEHKVESFSCPDQFNAMAFAQLTFRESLRCIRIAASTCVPISIVKKRAMWSHSLYELLQILSQTMFGATSINQLMTPPDKPAIGDRRLVPL